jgi:hypothetical protein
VESSGFAAQGVYIRSKDLEDPAEISATLYREGRLMHVFDVQKPKLCNNADEEEARLNLHNNSTCNLFWALASVVIGADRHLKEYCGSSCLPTD